MICTICAEDRIPNQKVFDSHMAFLHPIGKTTLEDALGEIEGSVVSEIKGVPEAIEDQVIVAKGKETLVAIDKEILAQEETNVVCDCQCRNWNWGETQQCKICLVHYPEQIMGFHMHTKHGM